MKIRFWKPNKLAKIQADHHCEFRERLDILMEQIDKHDCPHLLTPIYDHGELESKPIEIRIEGDYKFDHALNLIYGKVKYEDDVDFVRFLKEVLAIKKYQTLAKQMNLEFELSEDI